LSKVQGTQNLTVLFAPVDHEPLSGDCASYTPARPFNSLPAHRSQILRLRRAAGQAADFVLVGKQRLRDMPADKAGCSEDKSLFLVGSFFEWVSMTVVLVYSK
jgi:hypothetical protein